MRAWQALLCAAVVIVAFGSGACYAQDTTLPVTGKVLMPDGSPAAGAAIEARISAPSTDWQTEATATSAADGKFAMQLKQGNYLFRAASANLVSLDTSKWITVAKDGSLSKPIEIRLAKGCKVDGSVTDSSTGKPVSGVRIITRDGDLAESDVSGKWSMLLPLRNHAVVAVKDGFTWPVVNFTASGDTASVKVEIKPGGAIKGRVLDEQGKPISGARVGAETSGYFRLLNATTDADGRFTLLGLDPDARVSVSASADGYDWLSDTSVIFPAGQREAEIDLTLRKPKVRVVSGRVTKPDGSPVEGAKIGYGFSKSYVHYASTKTDKDGNYEIKDANIRKDLLVATCKGLAPVAKVVEADIDAKIDFQMKPGHALEGVVEDDDGVPIRGAGITALIDVTSQDCLEGMYSIADTTSGKDGKFKLDSLPEGEVYASVYCGDYDRIENVRLKVDRTDHTLVLRKHVPGQISGTVVRDSDGKPVTEFNVRLDFSRAAGRSSGLAPGLVEQGVNFQSSDGKFAIAGLQVKEGYRVIVTASGYMEGSADPVTVKAVSQDAYKDTVIRLRPAKPFEGTITAAGSGEPIEGVLVRAWNSPAGSYSYDWEMANTSFKAVSAHTDAQGRFRFDSMPFPFGMVMLEKSGLARTMLKSINFSRPLNVSMEKGATIIGTIADEQGKVPPGAWLSVTHKDLNMRFHTSQRPIQPDGSFSVTDLPPGEYLVGQYKESNSTRHRIFELKAGETYRVDWAKQGEVIVEGRVLMNGKPVPNARILVNTPTHGMNWAGGAESGPDGSYKLSLLKPATYFLSCTLGEWGEPNHIYTSKTLPLSAGVNQVDFSMPYGSISGKLLDRLTGRPVAGASLRLYVHETWKQNRGRDSLQFDSVEPRWWPASETKTDRNGAFSVGNLRAGEWLICAEPGALPAAILMLADGQAKSGIIARAPATGSAKLGIAGMKSLPKGVLVVCRDQFGMTYYPKYENAAYLTSYEDLPVGKLTAVVIGRDYVPTEVAFQVREGKTATIPIKLTNGPRIVFKPKIDFDAGPVSVGFRIATSDGKPVLRSPDGPMWSQILTHDPANDRFASITVKPGKYDIKAGAVMGDARNYGDDPELTGYSGTVTVVSGEDTIIEVPLNK